MLGFFLILSAVLSLCFVDERKDHWRKIHKICAWIYIIIAASIFIISFITGGLI